MVKPFFSRSLGGMVVGSMCFCGHLESDHGSKLIPCGKGRKTRLSHEGNCCNDNCACDRFTWERWVLKSELETGVTAALLPVLNY